MLVSLLSAALAGRYAMDDNHPEWQWWTLDTATARVHFPVARPGSPPMSGRWTAQRVAAEVDPIWTALCERTGHVPTGPVHIVVVEDTDQLEGFTLPADDWVVFSAHPGPDLARMRGRADWVPDLLAHELAHVVAHHRARTFPNAVSGLGVDVGSLLEAPGTQIGLGGSFTDGDPYWFSEGIAEYLSEAVGVNTWTSARDLTLRASVLDGRLLDPVRWTASPLLDDWYDGERAYQQGYAFLRWFVEHEGEQALLDVLRASSSHPRARWEDVFEEVTGHSLTLLSARFVADLEEEVAARVAEVDAAGRAEGRELAMWELAWSTGDLRTADRWSLRSPRERLERREGTGTLNLHAGWSPDGRWFGRHRGGWLEIQRVDAAMFTVFAGRTPDWGLTADQRREARRLGAWLPATYGSAFAFVPGRDAVVMVTEEGTERIAARARRAWNQLALVDLTPVERRDGPLVDDTNAAVRRRTTVIPGTERGFHPAVTPDGQRVVFSRFEDGSANLYVIGLDGTGLQALTAFHDGTWVDGASIAPDGRRAVATLHRGESQDLWVFDLDGGEGRPLLVTATEEVDPFWAPDGSIWFSADADGIHDVFRWSDGEVRRMTRVRTGARSPSLTPDGDLVYAHFTSFGWKTYGMRASELLWHPEELPVGEVPRSPVVPAVPERPYRALRALLPMTFSPSLRLDRAADGRVLPRIGTWLRLRDAVENHTLTGRAWVGADASVRGTYVWHGLWPDLGVTAGHAWTRLPWEDRPRTLSSWAVEALLPLRGDAELEVGYGGFLVRGGALVTPHRSRVATGALYLGDSGRLARRGEERGSAGWIAGTLGWSNGDAPYARLEGFVESVGRAPAGGDGGHRLVGEAALGITDRAVALEDRLRIGGDHPYALRPGLYQATLGMPGYGPYAMAADQLGTAGLLWRAPLVRRLGQTWGNVTVDEVRAELGGHLGFRRAATDLEPLGDLIARLDIGSVFLGRRVGSSVTVAWGAPSGDVPGGVRTIFSLGTGY
ncbi:MAG: PD40 domain-containing protein [Alphaproteobacteria bacterium]|nr:PD40 domain-containing protein [Alphaproteobacteria bacterium]